MNKKIAVGILFAALFGRFAFAENLLSLFREADYYSRLVTYDYTAESGIPLYRLGADDRPIEIGTIEKNRPMEILASHDERKPPDKTIFYLVKIEGDEGLWSGWVSSHDVHLIMDVEYPLFMLSAGFINISEDNERIVSADRGSQPGVFAAERTGRILYELDQNEVSRQMNSELSHGEYEGWSSDRNKLWFSFHYTADLICYAVIDLERQTHRLLAPPPHFGSAQIAVNFDTGDACYSDYYFAFDIDTAIEWNKSGRIYTLYKYNFFTEELTLLDKNRGEGFDIRLDEEGDFIYERANRIQIGKLNDSRVRIRREPNLESETLGHLSKNQMVNIIGKTEETMQIGTMNSLWYEVYTDDYQLGWAYGYFIDLVE